MKKILIINTTYRIFGGEDSNIIEEINFLSRYFNVKYLKFENYGNLSLIDLFSFLLNSNFKSNKMLKEALDSFNPELVIIHNTWFRANLGIFKILNKRNIPVALKLHNFRYDCTRSYFIFRHIKPGETCFKCGLSRNKKTLFNRYYPSNLIKSLLLVRYGKKYFKLIKNLNFKIIVLTDFHKDYLIKIGINQERIFVIQNPLNELDNKNFYNPNSKYILYAGRVDKSKGVEEILKAWVESKNELNLKIIGDGDNLNSLKKRYEASNIEFYGSIDHIKTLELIKNAKCVVTSTKMFEGQPRLLCEASLYGVPTIFPKFGGMMEFFPRGYELAFEQYNYTNLKVKLEMISDSELLKKLSKKVYKFIRIKLNEDELISKFNKLL